MAGMLPGVECARRRRFHQGGAMELQGGTRRSSFCLYRSGHESHLSSSSMRIHTNQQRNVFNKKSSHSEGLGDVAREARERLDERLRAQSTSEMIRRRNSTGSSRPNGNAGSSQLGVLATLQREVFCSKKSSTKFSWSRLGWKAADQDDCAVCLEEFKGGDILVHLPCAHRFHWGCVVPWLQNNSHCPCCRTEIASPGVSYS